MATTPRTKPAVSSFLTPEQQTKNVSKYGDKKHDIIARAYQRSKESGDVYCAFNADKYIMRYLSKTEKGGNPVDLRKAQDYINRMIEAHEEGREVIE